MVGQRARRVDAGVVRQTGRDAVVLEWLAHMYGAPVDVVGNVMGVSEDRLGQLVRRWIRAGWVGRDYVDAGAVWVWPRKLVANRFLGWDAREWKPRPTVAGHVRAVGAVRAYLCGLELDRWVSERQLWHEWGWRVRDRNVPHMPDGVEIRSDGSRVLVEVELTSKTRSRYIGDAGGGHVVNGVLEDVRKRAVDLGCSSVAYWCAPHVVSVIEGVVGEYRRREVARNEARVRGGYEVVEPVVWAVRSLEGVRGWAPTARPSGR